MDTQPITFASSPEAAPKMTDWVNEPTLLSLKQDFEVAKTYHDDHVLKVNKWNDLLHITGDAKPPKVKGRSSVQPKLVRRQAEWRYSALTEPFLSSERLFNVSPRTFEDSDAAKQNQLVINHQWDTKINKVRFVDEYVRTAVDEGSVIVRVGWKRVTVPIKKMVPEYTHMEIADEAQATALQQAVEAKATDLRTFLETSTPEIQAAVEYYAESGQPSVAVMSGEKAITIQKILENRPTYDIIDPRNFYIDPACGGDIDKAMFLAISFETCKAELLKEGKRYKNLDKVQWENHTPLTEQDHVSRNQNASFGMRDELRKKVVAYEYWGFCDINGDGRLVPVVCTWIGLVLIRMEENPFPDEKLPFVLVPYNPVKRELFGEPDAELLEDNQKIIGAVSRGIIDLIARSANSQQGFAKGMLDPLNRRRYENGQDYEFNPNQTPNAGLIEHKYPELPQSALTVMTLQNQEAEALTGVKSFAGGISGDAYGDVAGNARSAMDAASKREMGILRRLAMGMVTIGNKTISMNAVFLSEEEVVRISNEEFVAVKREDLAGNFDLKVDISTAEVDAAKAQDMGMMLQTIGPSAPPEMTFMIMGEIADLKRMPKLAHQLRNYKPQPDPMQQKLQELEILKVEKEIAELDSRIALNQANAGLKASTRDKADLDYLEQETGTAHEREMEKSRAQSQGNQALEVTKALTKFSKEGEKKPDLTAAIGFNQVSEQLQAGNPSQMM